MSSTDQLNGFVTTYTGVVRNVVAIQKSNRDKTKQWVENILSMEHLDNEGSPIIAKFKLSRSAQEAGLFAKLKVLEGKKITFLCTSQERIYQNRIYKDFYFSQTEVPVLVTKPQAVNQ